MKNFLFFTVIFLYLRGGGSAVVKGECPLCTLATGECSGDMGVGVLCEECSFRGYVNPLVQNRCVCSESNLEPANRCLSPAEISTRIVEVPVILSHASCECHKSYDLGFWKLSDVKEESKIKLTEGESAVFKYGLSSPPVCNQCYNEAYGPKPGVEYASILSRAEGGSVSACSKVGGPDPVFWDENGEFMGDMEYEDDVLDKATRPITGRRLRVRTVETEKKEEIQQWSLCSGHGVWDDREKYCVCDEGWVLEEILYTRSPDDKTLYTCSKCSEFFGPPTREYQENIQNFRTGAYCSVPWIADPIDLGTRKECGGHGIYVSGQCECFRNETHGYWQFEFVHDTLMEYVKLPGVDNFSYEPRNVGVLSCNDCQPEYDFFTGCKVKFNSTDIYT